MSDARTLGRIFTRNVLSLGGKNKRKNFVMQIKKAIFKKKIARKFNTISEDVKVMVEQCKEG